MLWVPAARIDVLQNALGALALPALKPTAPQPAIVDPSDVNATVPVGADPETVPVKVTLVPKSDGFSEDVKEVLVAVAPPIETERVSEPFDPGTTLVTLRVIPFWLSV